MLNLQLVAVEELPDQRKTATPERYQPQVASYEICAKHIRVLISKCHSNTQI